MAELFFRQKSLQIIDFINDNQKNKNVLILSGARQVGKTTLVKQVLKNKKHLAFNLEKTPRIASQIDSCEDFEDFENYLKDNHSFTPQNNILFIDEAQRSQNLGSFVRFMKEEWENATVILSGSLISELHTKTVRRPVGRESFIDLWPLSFKEFLKATNHDSLVKSMKSYHVGDRISTIKHETFLKCFDDYLKVGGLPEVVSTYSRHKNYKALRQDILCTYEDDFLRYYNQDDINLFKICLTAVANNVSSPSKDSHAIKVSSPGYRKIAGIFARLEKWRQIIKIEQIGLNPETPSFFPKRYLYDLGILCDLRLKGIDTISVMDLASPVLRTPIGGLIENHIALSLKNNFSSNLVGIKLSDKSEIDFSIKPHETVYPIECKLSLKFKRNYLTSLKTFQSKLGKKSNCYLFYGGQPLELKDENITCLPFYLADEFSRLIQEK